MSSATRIWFELMDPHNQDFDDFEALVKRLRDDYNAFFRRTLNLQYDKVEWNWDEGYKNGWVIITGEDGSFQYTDMKAPGFWLNVNALPLK
jgi:hypothetical protein